MKRIRFSYLGLLIAALLCTTQAIASDRAYHNFRKNDHQALSQSDQGTFNELHRLARQKGTVYVYINVNRQGERTEKDPFLRTMQGQYFAETKSLILADLGDLVVDYSERRPTAPDMYIELKPRAMSMILSDPRIQSFTVIRDRWSGSISGQTAADVATDMHTAIPVGRGDDGAGQIIVVIDTGVDVSQLPFPNQYRDDYASCFTGANPQEGIDAICNANGTAPGQADVTNHIPTSNPLIHASKWHGQLHTEIINRMAPGAEIIHIKVGSVDNDQARCSAKGAPAPCYTVTLDQVDQAFGLIEQLAAGGEPIVAVATNQNFVLHSGACDQDPLAQPISDLRTIHDIPTFVSTGNNGKSTEIASPACVSQAESVSAVKDDNGDIATSYANRNSLTEWYGIGGDTGNGLEFDYDGTTFEVRGTSWAPGQMAAMFAVLKSRNPNATAAQILQHIKDNANSPPSVPGTGKFPAYDTIYQGIDNIATSTPTTTSGWVSCQNGHPRFLISAVGAASSPIIGIKFQSKTSGSSTWDDWRDGTQVCVIWTGNQTHHRSQYETVFGNTPWSAAKWSQYTCQGGGTPQ